MYQSTRSNKQITSSMAIIKGLSEDGGLFVPTSLKKIAYDESWLDLSYQELAIKILSSFFDDFKIEELEQIVNCAYNKHNFPNKIVDLKLFDNYGFLELFHGPTLAFKDMALTILPYLLEQAKIKNHINKKTCVLVATSGDTGGAALSGFSQINNCEMIVLYPHLGVSEIQKAQMLYYSNNKMKALAYQGNFDDCQNLIKSLLVNKSNDANYFFTSANSINIGRLIPQIVYYFYAYFRLVKVHKINWQDKINIVVPTGNFGNILAGFMAKKMGLPINKLVCASNQNQVLTDFFQTGIYNRMRPFYQTNSPSMDILISSNLERLYYFLGENSSYINQLMKDLNDKGSYQVNDSLKVKLSDFIGVTTDKDTTLQTINNHYQKTNYLIDPHTAVGLSGYYQAISQNKLDNYFTLIMATASPYKFVKTIGEALKIDSNDSEEALCQKVAMMTKIPVPDVVKAFFEKQKAEEIVDKERVMKIWEEKL